MIFGGFMPPQVTGLGVVRAMLPEISPGSYLAPQIRYGIDFEGNDDGRLLRQLRIAPTLNINLPRNLFFTLYPSPDIRLNYGTPVWGQTCRLFLPRLHFQDSIESWLFILVLAPVAVDTTGCERGVAPIAICASAFQTL
jgi:hypothetical protein